MRMGWALLAIGAALLLAGCGDNKRLAVAECRMNAVKVYPDWSLDSARETRAADFTYFCMQSKGYVMVGVSPECPLMQGITTQVSATCYRKPWPWE